MGDVTERYCSQCGTTVPDEARFCIECGSEVPVQPAGGSERATQVDRRAAGRHALLETLRQATRGQYDVISELGRGGMATVFLAHDVALDRKVAIKVFAPDLLGLGETVRERFQREAQTAASLSHPHIIPIYAVHQSHTVLYFVMKRVEGRSLESVLREEGSLPVRMVVTILIQVGSALDYAHRNGVIHRDIKPANIMLDEGGYAIVTDFGIAKVAETEGLTVTGATVGTPAYMSPEQCMGLDLSGAADQYAMGVVAYHMLTGSLPFEGESAMTVMYKHTHDPPNHIAQLSPDVPRLLANAVMRMLAKSPEDRFPSMASLAEVVSTVREDEGAMRTQMISLARIKVEDVPRAPGTETLQKHYATTAPDIDPDSVTSKLKSTPVTPIPQAKPRKKKVRWLVPTAMVTAAAVWLVGPLGLGRGSHRDTLPQNTGQDEIAGISPSGVQASPASVSTIEIETLLATLRVGESLSINATGMDAAGVAVVEVPMTWESRDQDILAVTANGVMRGLSPGTTSVVVRAAGHATSLPVIVEAPLAPQRRTNPPRRSAVANISVAPESPNLVPGSSLTLTATVRDAAGRVLTGRPTQWRSNNPDMVQVSNGVITALETGIAVVTVVIDDRATSISVTVSELPVATLAMSASSAELREGETVRVRATALDSGGSPLDRVVSWRSDDPSVASVSLRGTITGVSQGATTVWAESDGQTASVSVTIASAPEATPAPRDPEADRAQIRAAIGVYGRAIEAHDMAALRNVFPAISPDDAASFNQFFETVTDLVVTLTVLDVQLNGDDASATVAGRYEFRLGGRARQSDLSLQLQLIRTGDDWQISAVQ